MYVPAVTVMVIIVLQDSQVRLSLSHGTFINF